jgi:hypothetical protein
MPVITSSAYISNLDYLLQLPLLDNGWGQIRIYDSDGPKIDPFKRKDFNAKQFKVFSKKYQIELECLAKNSLLSLYEKRYIKRFLSFLNQIDIEKSKLNFINSNNYQINEDEPYQSERDLMMELQTLIYEYLIKPKKKH